MVMTHTQFQVQRSVSSKIECKQTDVQTDGRTDTIEYITFPANAVAKNIKSLREEFVVMRS